MRGDHFLLILVLYFSTFLITCIHTQSIPTSEYIFILKSPSDDYDLTLEDYLNEQIQQFHTLLPTANILHIYSNFLQFGFISFTAKCNKNDLHHLENQFLNLKFYEESSYLTISRSLVKTVPFVSQYLRSETPTMQKSGFCTFSYEAYDQFLNDRGQYMDSPPVSILSDMIS